MKTTKIFFFSKLLEAVFGSAYKSPALLKTNFVFTTKSHDESTSQLSAAKSPCF